MSDTKQQLNEALKAAMRAKDRERRDAIRLLQSAIKQEEIDKRETLSDAAIQDILRREAKKRRETVTELEAAARHDEAAAEKLELAVTEEFLPRQLTSAEIKPIVQAAIDEAGATSMKDMGAVMRLAMPRLRGLADGKAVNSLVRELLG